MAAELVIPQEIVDNDDTVGRIHVGPYGGDVVIGRSEDGRDDVVAIIIRYAGRLPECTQVAKDHIIEILNAGGKV